MKISSIDQSYFEEDCAILQIDNVQLLLIPLQKNILIGSVVKESSILRFLPEYFQFQDDEIQADQDMSPKAQKRQKLTQKQEQLQHLLLPLNIMDCEDQDTVNKNINQYEDKTQEQSKLYKKIDSEFFIDSTSSKYQLRHLNMVNISDIHLVLVSNFNQLLGVPYITMSPNFKGKVIMSQPLFQIGYHVLMENIIINKKRNAGKDLGSDYFHQDQLIDTLSHLGIDTWEPLYSESDVDKCFNQHTIQLNFNEEYQYDNFLSLTPVSSGYQIGSSNWKIIGGSTKIGILQKSSLEGEFRHPITLNTESLKNLDVLLVQNIVNQNYFAQFQGQTKQVFSQQMKNLLDKIYSCLHSSLNAKILLPISPLFILEISDLLFFKIEDRVKITLISESAGHIIQYANINVEYLNLALQKKIYETQSPFCFDKLLSSERMQVFKNVQEYLKHKQSQGPFQSEIGHEIIIVTSSNMRLGESVYWLHNLNKHNPQNSFLILTDPTYSTNDLLMKPFSSVNQVKTFHCPVDPGLTMVQLNKLIDQLEPKRVVCPIDYISSNSIKNQIGVLNQQSNQNSLILEQSQNTIIEGLQIGESLNLTEKHIGTLKYVGTCPTDLANSLKMQKLNGKEIARTNFINLSFQDQKYHIKEIQQNQVSENQNLYFKLLELRNRVNNKSMIQLQSDKKQEDMIEQLDQRLQMEGFKVQSQIQEEGKYLLKLKENCCNIEINFQSKQINVKGEKNMGLLKKISDIVKSVMMLI